METKVGVKVQNTVFDKFPTLKNQETTIDEKVPYKNPSMKKVQIKP